MPAHADTTGPSGPPLRPAELRNAVLVALALVPREFLPPHLRGVEPADEAVPGLSLVLNDVAADVLLRQLEQLTGSTLAAEEKIAGALVSTARAPLLAVQHPDGDAASSRVRWALSLGTAFVVGKMLAADLGLRLRLEPEGRARLAQALAARNALAVRLAVAPLLGPSDPRTRRRPRALVVAPLTRVPRAEHPRLMREAGAALSELASLRYDAVGPDNQVTPESTFDDDPLDRHERERHAVLSTDLLVVVGAEHDSWGASKVVVWAELNATPVLVLARASAPVTRVLNGSPSRTTQQSYDSIADVRQRVRRWAARQLDAAAEHAATGDALTAALSSCLAQATAQDGATVRPGPAGLLPRRRQRSIVASPVAVLGATLRELLALPPELRGQLATTVAGLLRDGDRQETGAGGRPADGPAVARQAKDPVDAAYAAFRRGDLTPGEFIRCLSTDPAAP